jgi:superfamily II DNA or RNA helicase
MRDVIMSLKQLEVKGEYRSFLQDIAKEFYIPLLSSAIEYKRAVGYFSSTVLSSIADGVSALASNGGKIQVVASPYLSKEDMEAIKKGYELRSVIQQAILREMWDAKNIFEERRLDLLANLIADNILDIKIAFTLSESKMGMYHEKMGIIEDSEGNKVAFSGSMNDSQNALIDNYEVIDVWCSWKSIEQQEKVDSKVASFISIWNNSEPNIQILEFPEVKQEILNRYIRQRNSDYVYVAKQESEGELNLGGKKLRNIPKIPQDVNLHEYQVEAIDEWERQGFRGIFDMATGTGKTFTGLGAVARLSECLENRLAVVIVCPFQHLVEQWVEDIERFGIKPIVGYSASKQGDWLLRLENAILNQKLKVKEREFFCFICTNATFATQKVQKLLQKVRGDVLLLVDEAHNFGAERLSRLLINNYTFRLALSATIDRHNDELGTATLYNFFGKKCIEYSLDRAIEESKLVRYKYFPIITTLNDEEYSVYSDLSYQISKCIIKGNNGSTKLSEKGKILAMKRARLVAGSADKLTKLAEYIKPYVESNHILVYCGAANVLREDQDSTDTDENDLRQIDAVTDLLGNVFNMRVSQFTSKEDIVERERIKREFEAGDNLQALIAIKCLDEGVNIPAIKTAFILASTTNPKEYIQRRGRVLRLSKGKDFAEIYDFLALPRPLGEVSSLTDEQIKREITLVKNELTRAQEFARIAMNMAEAERALDVIKKAYSINDYEIIFREDFGNGDN